MIGICLAFDAKYFRNQEVNCFYEGWLSLNFWIQAKDDDGVSEPE